jgi:hypothetical protein
MDEPPAPPDRDTDDRDADGNHRHAQPPPPAKIQPVKKRIGEGPDNLRRRQSWFRKRTDDSE